MERKYIACEPELCTGCGICEMVCSAEKEGVFYPELSRIHLARVDEKTAMSIACRFCENRIDIIDYKDEKLLRKFITDRGKIVPRRISGNCAWHQRRLTYLPRLFRLHNQLSCSQCKQMQFCHFLNSSTINS